MTTDSCNQVEVDKEAGKRTELGNMVAADTVERDSQSEKKDETRKLRWNDRSLSCLKIGDPR